MAVMMPDAVMQVNRLSQQHSAMPTAAVVMGAAMIAAVAGQPLTYSELLQTPLSLRPLSGLTVADATDALPQGVARWMDGGAARGRPWTPHDGECLSHIAGNKNAEPPVPGACADDYGKNLVCEVECPVALAKVPSVKNCSKDLIDAFCNGDINCNQHGCNLGQMFSPKCHAKMLSMIDLLHPKAPPDSSSATGSNSSDDGDARSDSDVAGRRLQPGGGRGMRGSRAMKDTYQAFSSWSTHMGLKGHFYQCNALDTFYFWQAHFQCIPGSKPPLGEQVCFGQNQYKDLEMDLCVPEECNNFQDVKGIADAYAEVRNAIFCATL
jgi:hypothetical protein